MTTNHVKLEALLRYVIQECDDFERFGRTKLNKILWWADVEHRRRYGRTITGSAYRRMPNGPMLENFYRHVERLQRSTVIAETTPRVYGYIERRLVSLADERVELTDFAPSEIATIRRSIDYHRSLTAEESSARSHEQLAWRLVADNEIIPEDLLELTWEKPSDDDRLDGMLKPALTADDFAALRAQTHS